MSSAFTSYFLSPVGLLQIAGSDDKIQSVRFVIEENVMLAEPPHNEQNLLAKEAVQFLRDYFNGDMRRCSLPIADQGTEFQQKVWAKLQDIPYGKTVSYAELAKSLGNIKAIRAVAAANGKNPLAILVPCHRVIGSNNQLTGYMGGLPKKKFLLDLEAHFSLGQQKLF